MAPDDPLPTAVAKGAEPFLIVGAIAGGKRQEYDSAVGITKPNPKRLAVWAVAGATLAASTFFVPFITVQYIDPPCGGFWATQWANRIGIVAILIPFAAGGILWFLAYSRLKRDYVNDRWSEAELAPVRALLSQEYWMWMSFGLFGVAIAALAFSKHGGAFIYLVTLPMNALSSMRRLLTPPVERTGGLFSWKDFKPIHSDHWGEAPRSHNDALPS